MTMHRVFAHDKLAATIGAIDFGFFAHIQINGGMAQTTATAVAFDRMLANFDDFCCFHFR